VCNPGRSIAEHTRREARIRMLKRQETLLLENEELQVRHPRPFPSPPFSPPPPLLQEMPADAEAGVRGPCAHGPAP
jgi:hypothetical protein